MATDLFQMIRLGELDNFLHELVSADVNQRNEYQQNLLHEAVAFNAPKAALRLLELGVDVNAQDYNGQTPLHFAAAHNHTELAKSIVEAGADIHKSDKYGNHPLWTAVFNARGKFEIVDLLLASGANATHKNKAGRSPLDFAIQSNKVGLVERLQAAAPDSLQSK